MGTVRRVFREAGVPYAFMRGQALAQRYYLDPMLRVGVDVDVLVRPGDKDKALDALQSARLTFHGPQCMQRARNELECQAELIGPRHRTLVDVNWGLTANVDIGAVHADVDRIWDRAVAIGGFEYELTHEDVLFNVIRHAGMGHSFEEALVRACADVAAVLRVAGGEPDWGYIADSARACESLRIFSFFAFFFNEYYRDGFMPELFDGYSMLDEAASRRERELYARFILAPLVRRKTSARTSDRFVNGSLCLVGKVWALDKLSRLIKLMFTGLFPSRSMAMFLTVESPVDSVIKRRLRYYINPLLPAVPVFFLGPRYVWQPESLSCSAVAGAQHEYRFVVRRSAC